MHKKCLVCNKNFHVESWRVKRGGGKFCSNKCRGVDISINRGGKNSPSWRGGKIKRICQICHKEFFVILSETKHGRGRFCSRKCWGMSRIKEKNPSWKGGKVKRICQTCYKEFTINPSKMKQGDGSGKYCSRKCLGIAHTGKNSPLWKGENVITPITKRIRTCDKYAEWRQKIFIRDKFTCQKCKIVGGILHAHHHKKKFSELIDEIRENLPLLNLFDGAMIYTPLWDVSNGITYCVKCHKKQK